MDTVNHKTSDMDKQRILVKHPGGTPSMLIFNIFDTFEGRQLVLDPSTSCERGTDDYRNPNPVTITGFRKYAEIDGIEVWSEDIGEDAGGWQRIVVPLEQYNFDCAVPHTLEIGLKAVSPVSAFIVRGVTFFVDDVYLNRFPYEDNAVKNADFEEYSSAGTITNPNSLLPKSWTALNETDLTSTHYCQVWPNLCPFLHETPPCATIKDKYFRRTMPGSGLTRDEVRSGFLAYTGFVKQIMDMSATDSQGNTAVIQYYPGMVYNPGKYKAVRQQELWLCNNDIRTQRNSFNFTLTTNPAVSKEKALLMFNNLNEAATITVTDTNGTVLYTDKTNATEYSINTPVKPGIYFVTATNGINTVTKKWIVLK